MELRTVDNQKYLYPSEGYMLHKDTVVTDYLILGVNDNGEGWEEITMEEAEGLLMPQTEEITEDMSNEEIIL